MLLLQAEGRHPRGQNSWEVCPASGLRGLSRPPLGRSVVNPTPTPVRGCSEECLRAHEASFLMMGTRQQPQQPQPPPAGNGGQGSETVGTWICFFHLSAAAQVRRCENFSAHIVNTICHCACPDAAFLPGRKVFFIIYAECTLLKCCATRRGKEKPRRIEDSRDLPLGERLVRRAWPSQLFRGFRGMHSLPSSAISLLCDLDQTPQPHGPPLSHP